MVWKLWKGRARKPGPLDDSLASFTYKQTLTWLSIKEKRWMGGKDSQTLVAGGKVSRALYCLLWLPALRLLCRTPWSKNHGILLREVEESALWNFTWCSFLFYFFLFWEKSNIHCTISTYASPRFITVKILLYLVHLLPFFCLNAGELSLYLIHLSMHPKKRTFS